jgi:hypothetical protein
VSIIHQPKGRIMIYIKSRNRVTGSRRRFRHEIVHRTLAINLAMRSERPSVLMVGHEPAAGSGSPVQCKVSGDTGEGEEDLAEGSPYAQAFRPSAGRV